MASAPDGSRRLALEAQLASVIAADITARSERMRADGVQSCWFSDRSRIPWLGVVPSIRTARDEDDLIIVDGLKRYESEGDEWQRVPARTPRCWVRGRGASDPYRSWVVGGLEQATFSAETVARCVEESYALLAANARIQRHLSVFAVRFAADHLTAQAQAEGVIGKPVPEVLFLCTRNAGRSQMATALLAHHGNGQVHARSAGSEPDGDIEHLVLDALREIGIDSAEAFPKPITDEVLQAAEVIVTMGCRDACPVLPGKRYLDWDIHDPEGQPLHVIRAIRDDINHRVQVLMAELTIQHQHSETPCPTPPATTSPATTTASRACCSSACTTPAAPRWPPAGYATSPAPRWRSAPRAPNQPTRLTLPPWLPWPRWASTSPERLRACSTTTTSELPTITMGCGDTCSIYAGKRYEDWDLRDPAGKDLEAVRPIRDEIERRVRSLVEQFGTTARS